MNFKIGQKVVCIVDKWEYRGTEMKLPLKDGIYQIRGFYLSPWGGPQVGLYLEEIVNPPRQWNEGYGECAFNAERFRPLIERKTSIAVFEKIRDDATKKRALENT